MVGEQDPIVMAVLKKYRDRSDQGMERYGVSMYDNRAPLLTWIKHIQEELMDATLYTERMREGFEAYMSTDMELEYYQSQAAQTAVYPEAYRVFYPALGLAGEAGEIANKVKKIFRDQQGTVTHENRAALSKELGDVLWYLAALATDLDLNLSEVAEGNLAKLRGRAEAGTIQGSGDER